MKKLKSKVLNVMLVAALGVAALGGAMLSKEEAGAEAYLPAPSKIFYSYSSAQVSADLTDRTQTAFTFPNGGRITYRRDLALKWYESENASYLNFTFSFKDVSFEKLTFTFEGQEAIASDKEKSTNTVAFISDGTSVQVQVNDQTPVACNHSAPITISLSEENCYSDGEYNLNINGTKVGSFYNLGGYYADYNATTLIPLQIEAKLPDGAEEDATTVLLFSSLNGQSFALNEYGEIANDTAKPVLVLEDEISQFSIGDSFSFNYQTIDVLDESIAKTVKYYQYNPTDGEVSYKDLPSKGNISATQYEEGGKKTTVLAELGYELLSITVKLSDDKHNGDDSAVYELAWYAEMTEVKGGIKYIKASYSKEAPVVSSSFDFDNYATLINERAEKVNAGDSSYLYLPSALGMFEDDNTSQKAIRYDVYYKNESSATGSVSSNLSLSNLKVPVKYEGEYEIRIVGIDVSGIAMKGTNSDGELVDITSVNVWDIVDVPTFRFKIASSDLSMADEKLSLRSSTGIIDVKYTVEAFDVEGPSGYSSQYGLYFFDLDLFFDKYPNAKFDETVLTKVDFDSLTVTDLSKDDDVLERYAQSYANLLAGLVDGVDASELLEAENGKAIIRRIEERKTGFSNDVFPDNKFAWNPSARTFIPAEEGIYIVIGVFGHPEQIGKTVGGYHIVDVSATEDILAGESKWLQNNMTSIILFGVAAVLLVVIIVLLLVKPSDEKLEDITNDKKKEDAESQEEEIEE